MPAYFYHLAFELQANDNNNNQDIVNDIGRVLGKSVLPQQHTDLFGQFSHDIQPSTTFLSTPSQRHSEIVTEPSRTLLQPPNQGTKLSQQQNISSGILPSEHPNDNLATTPIEDTRRQSSQQQLVTRDWRFDRISIEGIDMTSNISHNTTNSDLSRGHSLNGSKTIEADTDAPAARGKFVPLDSKNTELGWGVVHLFRDGEETSGLYDDVHGSRAKPSSKKGAAKSSDLSVGSNWKEEDCTTLCILAVPSYLTPSDFLGFVGEKTTNDVSHFRMIRTERVNRYMVLMKFRDARRAREWRKEWNGKPFNSMEVRLGDHISQLCGTDERLNSQNTVMSSSSSQYSFTRQALVWTLRPFPTSKMIPSLLNHIRSRICQVQVGQQLPLRNLHPQLYQQNQ